MKHLESHYFHNCCLKFAIPIKTQMIATGLFFNETNVIELKFNLIEEHSRYEQWQDCSK